MTPVRLTLSLLMLCGLAAGPAQADVQAMVAGCDGCHGPDGVSTSTDMPTIAGISEFVHSDALFVYADGARPCQQSKYLHGDTSRPATDMCKIAAAMNEADMEAIAQYYAGKPFVAAKQQTNAALVAAGKEIHDNSCEKCHTEGGTVAEDDASILGGQQMGYLRRTFTEYAAGDREQPRSMKSAMDKLSKEDTEALVHFYASQQ
ncbi:MAG: cytochrome c-553 [Gammaproteobacteria bacterium]|nr:cytochrome c-553 [Gammaproteobacteria bacterium]NNF59732.1 cytochrome c-553 [Gammaproteobacteria bacterium]